MEPMTKIIFDTNDFSDQWNSQEKKKTSDEWSELGFATTFIQFFTMQYNAYTTISN